MIIAIQEIGTIVIDIDTTIGIQTELNPTTYSANTRIINHISPITSSSIKITSYTP